METPDHTSAVLILFVLCCGAALLFSKNRGRGYWNKRYKQAVHKAKTKRRLD